MTRRDLLISLYATLVLGSPLQSTGSSFVLPFTPSPQTDLRRADGTLNAHAALKERARLKLKYRTSGLYATNIRRSSGLEPLTDDYDGIDERKPCFAL